MVKLQQVEARTNSNNKINSAKIAINVKNFKQKKIIVK